MPHLSHRESVEPFATLCPGSHPAYCQCETIAAALNWEQSRISTGVEEAANDWAWTVEELNDLRHIINGKVDR